MVRPSTPRVEIIHSTPRCRSCHRGVRATRRHQMATCPAPPLSASCGSLGTEMVSWYSLHTLYGALCMHSNRSLHATADATLMCRRGAFIVCMWRGSLQAPTSGANGFSASSTWQPQPTNSTPLTCLRFPPACGCGRCRSSAVVGVGHGLKVTIRLRSRCNCQGGK